MIIGITGGTGCGKTTLLQMLADRGVLVLDCDAIYHELLRCDEAMLCAIQARFPDAFCEGQLDRKRLGSIVFADSHALQALNRITHSAVRAQVQLQLNRRTSAHAAVDAIALFEGGLASLCDVTVAVLAPLEDRVQRLMRRDGISEAYARARIAAQHDDLWFRQRCDVTLENDSTLAGFQANCLAFLNSIGIM